MTDIAEMQAALQTRFEGRRIDNLALAALAVAICICVAILSSIAALALTPVLIPLHIILRAIGRRGFWIHTDDEQTVDISRDAFRKATS